MTEKLQEDRRKRKSKFGTFFFASEIADEMNILVFFVVSFLFFVNICFFVRFMFNESNESNEFFCCVLNFSSF